ncbi:MAG: DegT/DnrJ/EryC1/StrS family aminotransferase [Actinomycetota bacterium]
MSIPGELHNGKPATFGGRPAFETKLPLARPQIADPARLAATIQQILEGGMLTNGPFVEELEKRTAEYLGVNQCVAVSSCTAGLMLILRASELSGDVIIPSFTFAATAHGVAWNGLRPVFADIDPRTLTLSPESVERVVGVRTSAILATHIFGTPCDIEGLNELASHNGIRLYFDAAHAFGSSHNGRAIGGFGNAEVFSLTPTKMVVAGEGGIIATNDEILAERCRMGRDYGHPGDYDCRFVGLNARMSEVHAATALHSLEDLDERVDRRNELVEIYRAALSSVPGVSFPSVPAGDRSTFKDFTVLIDEPLFGLSADELARALEAEGIETRRYYAPAVHTMTAYRSLAATSGDLRETEWATERVLTLPLLTQMDDKDPIRVAEAIHRIQRHSSRDGSTIGQSFRDVVDPELPLPISSPTIH